MQETERIVTALVSRFQVMEYVLGTGKDRDRGGMWAVRGEPLCCGKGIDGLRLQVAEGTAGARAALSVVEWRKRNVRIEYVGEDHRDALHQMVMEFFPGASTEIFKEHLFFVCPEEDEPAVDLRDRYPGCFGQEMYIDGELNGFHGVVKFAAVGKREYLDKTGGILGISSCLVVGDPVFIIVFDVVDTVDPPL